MTQYDEFFGETKMMYEPEDRQTDSNQVTWWLQRIRNGRRSEKQRVSAGTQDPLTCRHELYFDNLQRPLKKKTVRSLRFSQLKERVNRKSEIDHGFLSGGWIKGKTQRSMENLIYVKMDFLMMWCLLWEIPLFSPSNVFFSSLLSSLSPWLDSVICGKIEKIASITATFIIRN